MTPADRTDLHISDALEDAIAAGGKEMPVPGMKQPGDMEAGAQKVEAAPVVAAPVVIPEPAPVALEPVALEDLEKKLAEGKELSEQEQAAVTEIEKAEVAQVKLEAEAKAETDKITHNIGGKTFTFDELRKKMREESKMGNVDISLDAEKYLVDQYVKAANKSDAGYALGERQKAVAAERKALDQEKAAARTALDALSTRLNAQHQTLLQEQAKIAKRRALLEAAANSTVTEDEAYTEDGRPDFAKQAEILAKIQAQKELTLLAAEQEATAQESTKIGEELLRNEIDELMLEHPQYKPSEDLNVVWKKMQSGEQVAPADTAKVLGLISMVQTASTMKWPLKTVYESQKLLNQTLPEQVAQTTELERLPALPKPNQSMADMIKRHRERMAKAPASLGGGGTGGQRGSGKESAAAKMIKESQDVLGQDNDYADVAKLF